MDLISIDSLLSKYPIQSNRGGLIVVEYASMEMIDTEQSIILNGLSNIVFKDGYDWLKMPIYPLNKYGWSQKNKKDTQGSAKTLQLTGYVPRWTEDLERELSKMETREFVLRVRDRNGKSIILGRLDSPLAFEYGFNGGNVASELNSFSVTWRGRGGRRLSNGV